MFQVPNIWVNDSLLGIGVSVMLKKEVTVTSEAVSILLIGCAAIIVRNFFYPFLKESKKRRTDIGVAINGFCSCNFTFA
jgi:hypothetical protein